MIFYIDILCKIYTGVGLWLLLGGNYGRQVARKIIISSSDDDSSVRGTDSDEEIARMVEDIKRQDMADVSEVFA